MTSWVKGIAIALIVIEMLRLSPAVPFSLGNYLFGLAAIRLGPYVPASGRLMLPATFIYVYLGHIGPGLSRHAMDLRSDTDAQEGKAAGK